MTKGTAWALIAIMGTTLTVANAAALEIDIAPETITFEDEVVVRSSGSFDNKCFQITRHSVGLYEGLLTIVNEVRYTGNDCRDTVVTWEMADTVGPLPPGEYTVNIFEYVHAMFRTNVTTQTVEFGVYRCERIGDLNDDGAVNSLDLVVLRDYLVYGGKELVCYRNADVNCNGQIDIDDLTVLVYYLYRPFEDGPAQRWCGE